MYTNITVDQAKEKIASGEVVILDVRTDLETSAGHVDSALKIDVKLPSFVSEVNQLDKDKEYIVYCRSGMRSMTACTMMSQQGFTKLNNVLGGYMAWNA